MKPTYFDLTVRNLGEARTFFERVFGWRFEKFPMPYESYRIQAGPEGEPGIAGGIGELKDTPTAGGRPMTQVTVPVPKFWTQRIRIPALESHVNGLSLFGMGASFVSEIVIPYFQSAGQIAM